MPPLKYIDSRSGDTYVVTFSDSGKVIGCDRHQRHTQTNNLIQYTSLPEIEPPEAQAEIQKLVKKHRLIWVW